MKVQVEVDVPADMIVYDVGVCLIKCNRCGETAHMVIFDGDAPNRIYKFMTQHVNSCIMKQPSGALIHRSGSATICANKPSDTECDQSFPK